MILDLHDPALAEYREEAAKFADAFEEMTANRPPPDFSTPEGLAAARDISSYNFDAGDASDLPITPEDRVVHVGDTEVGVRVFRPLATRVPSTSTSTAAASTSGPRAWVTSGTPAAPKPSTWQS